jgi:hypothetical protein
VAHCLSQQFRANTPRGPLACFGRRRRSSQAEVWIGMNRQSCPRCRVSGIPRYPETDRTSQVVLDQIIGLTRDRRSKLVGNAYPVRNTCEIGSQRWPVTVAGSMDLSLIQQKMRRTSPMGETAVTLPPPRRLAGAHQSPEPLYGRDRRNARFFCCLDPSMTRDVHELKHANPHPTPLRRSA